MRRATLLATVAFAGALGCSSGDAPPAAGPEDGGADAGVAPRPGDVTGEVTSRRFVTREHFLASGEMQISGEPLAEAMGRDLGRYSRDHLTPDLYFDDGGGSTIDLPGFSAAIESYEYSKQPMNGLAFEWGAGTSLVHGPVVDAAGLSGAQATAQLAALVQKLAAGSHALGRFVFPAGTYPANNPRGGLANPLDKGNPKDNPLGWPGLWPTVHAFRSFDPTQNPSGALVLGCSVSSDDDPGASGALHCADYECDATSLHLADRAAQIEPTITPGADGFSAWKYGLWVINYLEVMHDANEVLVASVAEGDLAKVGTTDNQVVGTDEDGASTAAGTYLGSSDVEGFQAGLFLQELDDRAEDWVLHLSTTDGATLSGFASLADALAYDDAAPLRWFPGAIAVAESDDGSGFPRPSYSIASPDSDLLDLVGLAMGYAEAYALTDTANVDVGGSQPVRAYFDGDPFPADNQKADGEPTLHDRALAVLRVALVNLDRMHVDPATGVLVDAVSMTGGAPTRGATVSTTYSAYALLGLRTALRSLSSQLQLYSNNKPDSAIGETPIDVPKVHGGAETLGARMQAIVRAQADFLFDHLTDADGRAFAGWDLAANGPTTEDDLLDAHTAAIRGLFAAFLATGDVRFRERATRVFDRMQRVFYDAGARLYTATPAPSDTVEYGPLRFALLQSALRDVYELVATRPGGEDLAPVLEERLGRLDKLVLNGWDDRDDDGVVDWPGECVTSDGKRGHGGLQMAERTLSGESGAAVDQFEPGQVSGTSDREHDCVQEIDDARLPSALAESITLHVTRR